MPKERSPHPLRGRLALDTTDLDEVVAVASVAQHPLQAELDSPHAPLRFRLHHDPVGALAVTHAAFDHAGRYCVRAAPFETHYYLQVPLEGRYFVRQGGSRFVVAPGRCALLVSPGTPTRWEGTGGFREITVGIDADALLRYWQDLTGSSNGRPIRFAPAIPLDAEVGRTLERRVRALAAGSVVNRAAREADLLDFLLRDLPHDHSQRLSSQVPGADERLVRRAEAYLEATLGEAVTIQEVARAHEVSIRTLQRAFRRRRSTGPRRFLQDLRFSHVRTRLLQARDGDTVTRLAVGAGFSHLGQFSVDYRRRFGEAPSRTLSRFR